MTSRLQAMGQVKYQAGFGSVVTHPAALDYPLTLRMPSTVFVNSMSDTFHKDVPEEFNAEMFKVMGECPQHVFQVLTKRSDILADRGQRLPWKNNIWVGVTVENEDYLSRIDDLRTVPAAVRFLSIEPMIGPMPALNLEGIHWVIVGGETGSGSKPVAEEWVVDVRDQCVKAGVPFFFKQWGSRYNKKLGRELQGQIWNQMPATTGVDHV